MVVLGELSVKAEQVGQIVPEIDSWLSTGGVDADNSIQLLLANLSGLPQYELAQKSIGQWSQENKLFGEQFSGRSTEEVIAFQKEEVLRTAKGLEGLEILPVKELSEPGLYLKPERARDFFEEFPPIELLKGSSYASLEEVYKKYSPALIVGLSRRIEGEEWLVKYQSWIESLKQNDLESRLINIEVIDRDEFPSLQAEMERRVAKDDRVSGTVWFYAPLEEAVNQPAFLLRQSFWILHYIFETHNFGTKFSKIFQESGLDGCHLNWLFSPGMKKSVSNDYYFDVHALLEMIFWQRSFLVISKAAKEFSYIFDPDFEGMNKLVKAKSLDGGEKMIGFHPFNMVTNAYEGEVTTNSTTRRMCKLGILQKITNMSLDEVERALLLNLKTGNIGM